MSLPGAASGTEYDYTDGFGDQIFQRRPPAGWSPLSATDAELSFYGFPSRPTDPEALQEWQDAMTAWHGYERPGPAPCAGDLGSASTTRQQWSGEQVQAQTDTHLTEVTGKVTAPHTVSTCPSGSSDVAMWVGLGALLQAGIIDQGSTNNNWQFWYEATLGGTSKGVGDTDIVPVYGPMNSGDNVYLEVFYDTTANQVTFYWEDLNNSSSNSMTFGTLASDPVSDYWAPQPYLSQAILERTTNDDGSINQLREWDSGAAPFRAVTVWKESGTNGLMESYNHSDYDMTSDGTSSGRAVAHWADVTGDGAFNVAHDNYCS